MIGYTENDFDEDFIVDNGMYQNICHSCGIHFIGHKRRPHCKVCHTKGTAAWNNLNIHQQNTLLNILGNNDVKG